MLSQTRKPLIVEVLAILRSRQCDFLTEGVFAIFESGRSEGYCCKPCWSILVFKWSPETLGTNNSRDSPRSASVKLCEKCAIRRVPSFPWFNIASRWDNTCNTYDEDINSKMIYMWTLSLDSIHLSRLSLLLAILLSNPYEPTEHLWRGPIWYNQGWGACLWKLPLWFRTWWLQHWIVLRISSYHPV